MTAKIKLKTEPKKILLVLPTWVGDVVMATPFIESVFRRFESAQVSVLMYRHLADVLHGTPWMDNAYFWPGKSPKTKEEKRVYAAWRKQLKAQQFDMAILLPNSLRVAVFAWRIGAKKRVGFNRDGRRILLTDAIEVPNKTRDGYDPLPLVKYYEHLANYLGCAPAGDQLTLATSPQDTEATFKRLKDGQIRAGQTGKERKLVVVCPGANFGASKCWPPERFAGVADQLVKHHNAAIVISPGPGEEPLAQAIADHMQASALVLKDPCLTLGELKSLIDTSDLLLGNDTGPRHFARAFDIPRVTVFGPTEARWTDTSHDKETIVRVEVPCGPCHKKVCPLERRACMDDVTVEMVYAACDKELNTA